VLEMGVDVSFGQVREGGSLRGLGARLSWTGDL
jgi:hypothetical protein